MSQQFKWKEYKRGVTMPRPKTQAELAAYRDIHRELREAKERWDKSLIAAMYGIKLYHHGDPV